MSIGGYRPLLQNTKYCHRNPILIAIFVTSWSLIFISSIGKDYISQYSSMVFIQSNDRKWRYEFRTIKKTCKMRSVYKNQIRAKQENKIMVLVISTQQCWFLLLATTARVLHCGYLLGTRGSILWHNGSGRVIGLTILPIHTLASGC